MTPQHLMPTKLEPMELPSVDPEPLVPIMVIDAYIEQLRSRKTVSAVEVTDLLLDIRNAVRAPANLTVEQELAALVRQADSERRDG